MEPRHRMKRSIKRLVGDLERVGTIVRNVESELQHACLSSLQSERLDNMKQELGEIHARLDGVREFLLSCEQRAAEKPVEQEDIDLWL